jgi:uncharacterized protein YjgD (DUF1641 family)
MQPALAVDPAVAELNQKLDRLARQVEFLTEEARRQKRRQQEWDELKDDAIPVFNELFRLSVQQLAEIEPHAQLEDVLRLFKRLLRNTRNLEQLLDQLESFMDLWHDLSPLSQGAFLALMNRLNELEQKGYFVFLQGGLDMADRIVTSFDENDVRQLGENIVLILQTIKEMTQPEIMTMLRNTATVVRDEEPVDTSLVSIIRQLNDPAVRKGLAKTLKVLSKVGD